MCRGGEGEWGVSVQWGGEGEWAVRVSGGEGAVGGEGEGGEDDLCRGCEEVW